MSGSCALDKNQLAALGMRAAWRIAPHLPEPVVYALSHRAADLMPLLTPDKVRTYRANLQAAWPNAHEGMIVRWVRDGLRAHMRYYADLFRLDAWTPAEFRDRVRTRGIAVCHRALAEQKPVIFALGHVGNWDVAAAWAGHFLTPVSAVAERLSPPELFDAFVRHRARHGVHIVGLDHGFRIVRLLVGEPGRIRAVCLLFDRDLTGDGIETPYMGGYTRMAPGPAALTIAAGAALVFAGISSFSAPYATKTLSGRYRLRRRWCALIEFAEVDERIDGDSCDHNGGKSNSERRDECGNDAGSESRGRVPRTRVQALTRELARRAERHVRTHPTDWHLLVPVHDARLAERMTTR
ncbi:LpxL/LpxP family acyltransferase [Devriesea agamarum]|uniref:LpxL/LpxP family acyltransferase n=1 Tax=Devriesea agamarum TaxID=472569 RepID=UPI0012EED3E3|nr:hypothetical protein [Devriesea agamarum]